MTSSGATFSPCRSYRYVLWRVWEPELPLVNFVGLNPSTADENLDDPTMRRCRGFAQEWGFGGFLMTNLFAFRATRPEDLRAASDPVGPENDAFLREYAEKAEQVVFAWGVHGTHLGRDRAVIDMLDEALCIGLTQAGHPRHPLYLRKGLQPEPFPG